MIATRIGSLQHGAHLRFRILLNPQTKGRRDATGQLADAAEHHHQNESMYPPSSWSHCPQLGQYPLPLQPGNAGPEAKRQHIYPSVGTPQQAAITAVLRHRPHVQPPRRVFIPE